MKDSHFSFEHSWKNLLMWFFCTYIIFGPILDFMRSLEVPSSDFGDSSLFSILFIANSMFCFFLFLLFAYLAFYTFFDRNKFLLIVSLFATLIIPIAFRFLIDQKVAFWAFGVTNYFPHTTFKYYYSDNTYFAIYYIPSGILYYFYRRIIALQEAKLEEEKLRNEAEIAHLRSQINPHFLFNSLNNIYSLAYDKSDKILGAIEGLSELLRYALYEKSEKVPFKKEWNKILQLIKIEHLRLGNPVEFKIELAEGLDNITIPPVILLPLIENVFKHGDVQTEKNPPQIKAWIENDKFNFKMTNKLSSMNQKDNQHGIGLINIKKRLEHIYDQQASFVVQEKDDIFISQISIPIND